MGLTRARDSPLRFTPYAMSEPQATPSAPVLGAPSVPQDEPKPLPATPAAAPASAVPEPKDDAAAPAVAPAAAHEPATTLPVGHGVHPVRQAEALDSAPDHLVDANVQKQKGAERELQGKPEQGTIVPGIEDDKLWYMRRRFDTVSSLARARREESADLLPNLHQQIVHVLTPPTKLPPGEPDLRPSTLPNIPFNSDLLKSNLERVYATAGVWAIYSAREAMRLMSWAPDDRKRTGLFCVVSLPPKGGDMERRRADPSALGDRVTSPLGGSRW